MRTAIVTTSVNVPHVFGAIADNAEAHGHGSDDLWFIYVGDRKSPPTVGEYLCDLEEKYGHHFLLLDAGSQEAGLLKHPPLRHVLRWNSVQRRNLGFLEAARCGAETIISVDDDNWPVSHSDFIGGHSVAGNTVHSEVLSCESGWFDTCSHLTEHGDRFFHRGFPRSKFRRDDEVHADTLDITPVVNAGMWVGTPDVDATCHTEHPFGFSYSIANRSFALGRGTWAPFNTQNTAFSVGCLPAMWLPVMGDFVKGRRIQRFDDIFMSYFLRVIADKLGMSVMYGAPLVEQKRNPHSYLKDLAGELAGYEITEWLVDVLRDFRTESNSWGTAYEELTDFLRDSSEHDNALDDDYKEFWRNCCIGMACWSEAIKHL